MGTNSKKLPRHVAAIRLSAMGDVVMLAHTLRAFKAAYPDVKVSVAARSSTASTSTSYSSTPKDAITDPRDCGGSTAT